MRAWVIATWEQLLAQIAWHFTVGTFAVLNRYFQVGSKRAMRGVRDRRFTVMLTRLPQRLVHLLPAWLAQKLLIPLFHLHFLLACATGLRGSGLAMK